MVFFSWKSNSPRNTVPIKHVSCISHKRNAISYHTLALISSAFSMKPGKCLRLQVGVKAPGTANSTTCSTNNHSKHLSYTMEFDSVLKFRNVDAVSVSWSFSRRIQSVHLLGSTGFSHIHRVHIAFRIEVRQRCVRWYLPTQRQPSQSNKTVIELSRYR